MGVAFVPLYIKYLGMEAYGLIGLFAVIQACLSLLDMGMTPTLNREMARYTAGNHSPQSIQDMLRSIEFLCYGIAVLILLSIWVASGYFAQDWLKVDKIPMATVERAISVMAVVVTLRFVEGIYRSALFGLQRQVLFNGASAVFATLRNAGVVVILAWGWPTIQAFFFWQAAVSILSVGMFAAVVHRSLPVPPEPASFSPSAIASVWRFAGGVMGITIVATVLTQVDKIILSRLLPLEMFGYYALAGTIASIPYMIIGPITSAIYPRMVELYYQNNDSEFVSAYHQGAQLVTVLTAPFVMLLFNFSVGAVFMWSGDVSLAKNIAPILSALVVASFLNGLVWMPYHCQLALGWTSLVLKINVVGVILFVPSILILVPRYGAVSAAWIWAVLNVGIVISTTHWMHRKILLEEKWKWYYADVLLPTLGAAGAVFLSSVFQPERYEDRWRWFLFLLCAGILAMLASATLGDHIRSRIRKMIGRQFLT